MNNFNTVDQVNKKLLILFLGVSFSSFYFYQAFSFEVQNSLVTEAYGVIQKFPIEIDYAHFISPLNQDNQIKVLLKSLTTSNDTELNNSNNKTMNAVMKVYSVNGTLLKTSSYPQGFHYNNTEPIKLATNIADKSIETVMAVIQLTNLEKTQPLSDPLTIKLRLGQVIDR